MAKKNQPVEEQKVANVQEPQKEKPVGTWFERNRKKVIWVVSIIVGLALVGVGVYFLWYKPTVKKINENNAAALVYFMQGDWDKALNGDGADCVGFKAVADKNKRFQGSKLAAAYAGMCYYNQGLYEDAIVYLDKFSSKDEDINFKSAVLHMKGNAYVNLGQYDKALEQYNEAINMAHPLVAPACLWRAGLVYLEKGDKAAAKKEFEKLRATYPQSFEAQGIDKYINFAQ